MQIYDATRAALLLAMVLAVLTSACGDDRAETLSVSKLLAGSRGDRSDAKQLVDRAVTELGDAGMPFRASRCMVRSTQQPAKSFYVIVDIPASQLRVARRMGFQPVAELMSTEASLISLHCAMLWIGPADGDY